MTDKYQDSKCTVTSLPTFENLNESSQFFPVLELLFFRELQSKLPNSGPSIIVNTIDPGYCATSFNRKDQSGWSKKIADSIERRVAMTTEEGSRQIIYGAVAGIESAEEEAILKGAYIAMSQVTEPSDFVISELGVKAQGKVWVSITFSFTSTESLIYTLERSCGLIKR